MADYEVKRIDEMEAAFLGSFKRARAELGVESFGMQVIDLPPNFERYPEHDHSHDGQEEVFVAMRGGAGSQPARRPRPNGPIAPRASLNVCRAWGPYKPSLAAPGW